MASPAWSGASLRNRGPILTQLLNIPIPPNLHHALEVGTGLGAHIDLAAPALPHLIWHPTDLGLPHVAPQALASPNVLPPQSLDASLPFSSWPETVRKEAGRFGLALCVNVIHISPWEVTVGLFRGAAVTLGSDGWIILYGPFFEEGKVVAEGNIGFDRILRETDTRWGVRKLEHVTEVASTEGFAMEVRENMPANNLFVGFRKRENYPSNE